jgi:pimeloyl-ACP methyl ester carboxylesterase
MSEVEIETGFIDLDDTRLYYEVVGQGEPIVLIHGRFGDRRHWDAQFEALAGNYRVLRYDVRGFGRSSMPAEGVAFCHHDDLVELLKRLGLASAHVVGFSMGSEIAFDFALAHPDMSRSLVSVGPWVGGYESEAATAFYDSFDPWRQALRERRFEFVRDQVVDVFFRDSIRDPDTRHRVREIAEDCEFWEFTHANPAEGLTPPAIAQLDALAVPVLAVTAEHDLAACVEVADLIDRAVPGARKISIAGTGHFIPLERPEKLNRIVLDFLREETGELVAERMLEFSRET